MKKLILACISIVFLIGLTNQQQANIHFELPDLVYDYDTDTEVINLVAFKSSSNDYIIEERNIDKYGQLYWLSLGYPKLVQTFNSTTKRYELFAFRPEGFDVSIETLTPTYRTIFKNLVKQKYKIDVNENQIVSLVPSRFECQITFYKDNSKILINGKVNQLSRFPLKLSFEAPLKSKERIYFDERYKADQNRLNLDIECQAYSQGKVLRQNTLIIRGEQINQIGLMEEIFGNGNEKYVSRNQISSLSSKLYFKLNVMEDYEIPETQFKIDFVDEFIKQTSTTINQYVSFDQALSLMSKYDLSEDLKPSVIKSEYSKLFSVNKTGSREYLQLNQKQYEKLNTQSSSSGSGSLKLGIKLFNFGGSANYAQSQKSEWERLGTSFSEQLSELNTYSENEIEWARSGNIIIPKSLKVSKLSRSLFSKDLIFTRVKRESYTAPYNKSFTLEILSGFNTQSTTSDNSLKIDALEQKTKRIEQLINDMNNLVTKTTTNKPRVTDSSQRIPLDSVFFVNPDRLDIKLNVFKNAVCNEPERYGFVQRYSTNKYYMFSDLRMNWNDAIRYCESFGATLPIIRNSADSNFLRCKFLALLLFVLKAKLENYV